MRIRSASSSLAQGSLADELSERWLRVLGVVHTRSLLLTVLVVAVVLVGACGSSSDSGDDAAQEPAVDQILIDAGGAMSTVESASFMIEQTGARVFIDEAEQLGFQSADGRFARPASSEAVVTVDALGFTTEVGAIAVDGDLWFTNPLSGEWTEAPASFTFDTATLFEPERGFPALLAEAAASAELIADSPRETGRGHEEHHIRAAVAAERVSVLTGGLVAEETDVDLWIDDISNRIVELRFELLIDDAVSSWRMTISDYDDEVTIAPPELGATG